MYETNEYPVQSTTYGRRSRHRWVLIGGALAAALLLIVGIALAAGGGGDDPAVPPAAGSSSATPTGDAGESAGPGTDGEGPAGGSADGSGSSSSGSTGSGSSGGGGPAGGGSGSGGEDPDPDDQEEPPGPLNLEVSVDVVTPGGQCFASGTIAVSGGEYPVTVHYQWRRLVLGGGFEGVPVSAVLNVTFDEPGEAQVQTSDLPKDGTNVMLLTSGPVETGSGVTAYDGCTDGPGDIAPPPGG